MFKLYGTLSLYVARRYSLTIAGALGVLLVFVFMIDAIELLRRTISVEVDMETLVSLSLMKLPRMAHQILPFAILTGTMVLLWRLSRSHEVIVMRAAGVSVWQFLAPMVMCAFIFGATEVMVVNPLSSALYKRYEVRLESLHAPREAGDAFDLLETGVASGARTRRRPSCGTGQPAAKRPCAGSYSPLVHHADRDGHLYRRIDARRESCVIDSFCLKVCGLWSLIAQVCAWIVLRCQRV